jgi:hypothetical protein
MALTPEEEAELAELAPKVRPELRAPTKAASGAVVDQPATPGDPKALGGIKAVYDSNWTPHGPGGQPIAQTPSDRARDEAAAEAEAGRVVGMLDPRFSLVPQVLALQPATNDLQGDEAARQKYEAGQKDVVFIYEPPVDVVRRHLLENPALLRAISPDSVPTQQQIEGLTKDSDLYQTAADWMYQKAEEAASAKGQKIARYSKAPWLWGAKPGELAWNGAAPEVANMGQAFVLGVDDMGAAGAGRAAQEAITPTSTLTQPRPGVNESVPHPSAEVNAWTEEEYPGSYAAGQVVGALSPRSVFNKLWGGIQKGGGALLELAAKTRLGGLAAVAPAAVKTGAGIAGDAATGAVGAAAGQVVQEGVDAASSGQMPDLREAGGRVWDVGKLGGVFGGLGSAGGRASGYGADSIRDSPRFTGPRGPGAVRRTEPNMEFPFGREPRLSGETGALVKEANAAGVQPGDILAEEIAPKIRDAAQGNTRVAEGRARATVANAQRTPEGSTPQPMSHLHEASLEKLRDHHQPGPGGLHAVDDKYRPAAKVFNRLAEDVSTSPIEGAVKLDPDEAASFLDARMRYKLLKDDIEAANQKAGAAPAEKLDREAYLKTIKDSRARAAADEEIEASIEDIVGDVTPTPARRAAVEQQVLREMVEEASFREVNGSLGDYLRARGIDAVYVKPRAYDARRSDTLTKGLTDEELLGAAKLDRQRRPLDGKKGGYDQLVKKGEDEIAKAKDIEKSVAPGGDAFQPVAGLYQSRPGEKQLVDRVKALADQSGTREQLERLRGLQEALAIQNRASFRGPQGQTRSPFAPQNLMDAAQLRVAFPALRALEGPLGPLRGGNPGRAALLGSETDEQQAGRQASARSRYGALRDQRLKEIAAAKDAEARENERRQNEPLQRRR